MGHHSSSFATTTAAGESFSVSGSKSPSSVLKSIFTRSSACTRSCGAAPQGVSMAIAPHPRPTRCREGAYPLAVPGVQGEPERDGAALALGHGFHPMGVLRAGGETHGTTTLRLNLCLPPWDTPVGMHPMGKGGGNLVPMTQVHPLRDGGLRGWGQQAGGGFGAARGAELLTVSVLASSSVK